VYAHGNADEDTHAHSHGDAGDADAYQDTHARSNAHGGHADGVADGNGIAYPCDADAGCGWGG
jgi:hypothetical protein